MRRWASRLWASMPTAAYDGLDSEVM